MAGMTEVVSVPSRLTMALPMPVAVITEEKEPPAPVMARMAALSVTP